MRAAFKKLNIRKDMISPALLCQCAAQLAPIFSTIFNTSLSQCTAANHLPSPVPKSSKITCLNDFRPVALTSVAMKAFERIVLSYLKSGTSLVMDPHQFADPVNRSVEDAVSIALHHALENLESPNTHPHIHPVHRL